MTTPVCDFVRSYAASGTARLHMPGHKGQSLVGPEALDITEIKDAGELYEATGTIDEGERNTTALFGTEKSCWVTEGSSQCIRAMLALVTQFGAGCSGAADRTNNAADRPVILAARNAHRAFLTACALLDLDIRWLWPEESFTLCSCPVTPLQVEEALTTGRELPAAVYLTSPDYLGRQQDVAGIAAVCHAHGVPLLVDNAHGAYLKFLQPSRHPIDLGADLCCDSAHKTLPALTGCAYLHIRRGAPLRFAENAKRALSLFGSTSPSWLLLQSLDAVNAVLEEEFPSRLAAASAYMNGLRARLEQRGWAFTGEEPLKLTLCARKAGYTGERLAEALRSGGVEPEYADPDYVVLMASPWNTERELQQLEKVLLALPLRTALPEQAFTLPCPEQVLSPQEAMLADAEEMRAAEAAGRILASPAMACPPAISVITCGERIPQNALPLFAYYGIDSVSVVRTAREE